MTNDLRIRYAVWAGIAHTAIVAVAVSVKNGLHGEPVSLTADRWLRVFDAPVLWLVDRALQTFSLPAEWFYPRLPLALGVHEFLAYGLFGGAFYVCVAAAIAYARQRRRDTASLDAS